ncbi:MAG: hypothetical protein ACPL1K_03370, partial [Candidatus Kryptoniota bacterium]
IPSEVEQKPEGSPESPAPPEGVREETPAGESYTITPPASPQPGMFDNLIDILSGKPHERKR